MSRLLSPAAAAVQRCQACLARLAPPSESSEIDCDPSGHFGQMAGMLGQIRQVMLRAEEGQASQSEVVEAAEVIDQVIIRMDETRGLGEHPLPPEFLFELLALRLAIREHQDGIVTASGEEMMPCAIYPDISPAPDWDNLQCAAESARVLLSRVEGLLGFHTVVERSVGMEGTLSLTTIFVETMIARLQDIVRELEAEVPNFDLAVRLSRGLQVELIILATLDPTVSSWSLKGAFATLGENIDLAKLDPYGPRPY